MRTTTANDEQERLLFAQSAATYFEQHPNAATFGNLKPGKYLAMRWGLGNDCVLVLKLDEEFEPVNYTNLIVKDPAK